MAFNQVRIGDYFQLSKGLGYLGKYLEPSGVGLIGLNSFEAGGGYKFGGEKPYSGPYKEQHRARPGDLFIATTDITQDGRVLGSAFLLPSDIIDFESYIFSGDIVKAEPVTNEFMAEYLFNILRVKTVREKIAYASTGTTVRRVPVDVIENVLVSIPSVEVQKRICLILSSIDRKIRVNQKIASTLEQIAQTIFKSWFVDFDPVHAKARGEQPVGMDAETAALFPDSFEESELGPIPSGWLIKSLTDVAEYRNGLALQKYPELGSETDLPVLKIPQLKANSTEGAGYANAGVPEKFIVEDGDCIFSWSGALEVRIWFGGVAALNQHLFKVVPHEAPIWYAYLQTLNHLEEFRAIADSKATTMGHIKRSDLENAKFALCPDKIMEKASEVLTPLFSEIVLRGQQNRTLTLLRDSLLPRLISGELEIPAELLGD